jgi:allophanate hydrolase
MHPFSGMYYLTTGHKLQVRDLTINNVRFGVPSDSTLKFFGAHEQASRRKYYEALSKIQRILENPLIRDINFEPWTQVASILYDGPWISERLSGIEDFYNTHPDSIFPITKQILDRGHTFTAMDTFRGMRHLERLRRIVDTVWNEIDVLIVPTASTTPKVQEVLDEPYAINQQLGFYTNFLNLLDLCGLAVPNGFLAGDSNMPTSITLIAPAFNDHIIKQIGAIIQEDSALPLGHTNHFLPPDLDKEFFVPSTDIAVVGAHLSGEPLNYQLADLGATKVKSVRTKKLYRLYDLDGKKPGIVRVNDGGAALRQRCFVFLPSLLESLWPMLKVRWQLAVLNYKMGQQSKVLSVRIT